MVTLRKTIIIVLFGSFVGWLIFGFWIDLSYASNLPDAPNDKTGRIYRMVVNHGFVRYGTEEDLRLFRWMENTQPVAMTFLVMGIVLAIRYKQDFDQNKKTAKGDIASVIPHH
jgi:hypothetical protein